MGIVEDMLVKVDKFIFPVDFVILGIDAEVEVSGILGRPFLLIGRAFTNVQNGELMLRMMNDEVIINVHEAMKHPWKEKESLSIDMVTL